MTRFIFTLAFAGIIGWLGSFAGNGVQVEANNFKSHVQINELLDY